MKTHPIPRAARAALALLTIALLQPRAALADPPIPAGMAINPWTLAFEDTFDGAAVDTAKWNYRADISKRPGTSTPLSWQRPENVSLSGGNMKITLSTSADTTKAPFSGGGLISKQKFRYGFYETAAKVNKGGGWHSAFWMMDWDASTQKPTPTRATEIDQFEIDSASPTKLRNNIITWQLNTNTTNGFGRSTGVYDIGMDLSNDFHKYGMAWDETGVRYYVDDVLKATQAYVPGDWLHDMLSIWLTTIAYTSGTPVVDPSGNNASLWQYVRYWQKDYYVDNKSATDATGGASGGPDGVYAETSGTWLDSGLTGWTKFNPTRYATCGMAGATATWTPLLKAAGVYEAFVYKVAYSSSDINARYDVLGVGSAPATYVNGSTGTNGWVSLGSYAMPAGTAVSVQLTSSGTGCARADAVKFVRVS